MEHFEQNKMNNSESCAESGAALASQFEQEECMLCTEENGKNRADVLACFDMAKGGEGDDVKVFTLEAPCCGECRKKYNIVKYIPTAAAAGICVITIACLSFRETFEALSSVFFAFPILIMAIMLGVSFAAAKLIRKALVNKFSKKTYMNILDTYEYSYLKQEGVVEVNAKDGISSPVFSNESLKN